jgi:hypothetical protein
MLRYQHIFQAGTDQVKVNVAKRVPFKPGDNPIPELRKQAPEPPLAPTTEEGRKAYDSVLKHGFPSFPKPVNKDDPASFRTLPANLSSMGSDDLADELGYWTAMQSYANEQATLVWNDLEAHKRQVDKLVDARLSTVSGGTITEKKARARMHPDAQLHQNRTDHLQSVYNLIDAIRSNCAANYATISRVVSTREVSAE